MTLLSGHRLVGSKEVIKMTNIATLLLSENHKRDESIPPIHIYVHI